MKKRFLIISAAVIAVAVAGAAFAAPKSAKELAREKKAELNGTQWAVTVRPAGSRGSAEEDIITFAKGKVNSQNLSGAGFPNTDFTVRVEEDGNLIWETMQIDEDGNHVFWRGDVKNGIMRGMLSKRDSRGRGSDYSFVSR